MTSRFFLFMGTAACCGLAYTGCDDSPSSSAISFTQYLSFQMFTPTRRAETNLTLLEARLEEFVGDLVETVGEVGDSDHRLAFAIGPMTLSHSDDQLAGMVDIAFKVAREHDVAVAFHLDDSMFWDDRQHLGEDPLNIEWLDWDGATNPASRSTGRRIDWSDAGGTKLAPQLCFNAPAVLAEIRHVAGVLGSAIAANRAEDNADFAGVMVGWETMIGSDFDTGADLGFCALHHAGYGPESLPAEGIDLARVTIVGDWIETWSEGLAASGVPPDLLYSHTAGISRAAYDASASDMSYESTNHFAPLEVSAGHTAFHPGYSLYPAPGLLEEIHELVAAHDRWAMSEGTNVPIGGDFDRWPLDMESFLAQRFNRGATLVNLFAFGLGPVDDHFTEQFQLATESAQAVVAYRKFLHSEPLIEAMTEKEALADYVSRADELATRVHALQARLHACQEEVDLSVIAEDLTALDTALAAGDFEAIEQAIERLDARLDELGCPP